MKYSQKQSSHKRPVQSTGTGRYKLYGMVFAFLPAYYPGLKVRQLERRGRVVLDEVLNDRPPYWFVTLLNARAEDQALLRQHFGPRFGGGRTLGNRRFTGLADARSYFEALCQISKFAAEIERGKKVKADRKERLIANQSSLKMYSTPPTKTSSIQKGKDFGKVKCRPAPVAFPEKEGESGRVENRGTPVPFLDRGTLPPLEASTELLGDSVDEPEEGGL
jgi:hypothetical protein